MKTLLKATALALALLSPGAWAAGGHHAVDDAGILDEGQCKLEGWFARAQGGERGLHAGTGCRVGPVELTLATDHARPRGAGSETGWSLQGKWAMPLSDSLHVGFALTPAWQAHQRPRYAGVTAAGLLTWEAGDALALHLNLGRDLLHGAADENRSGLAVEWRFGTGWEAVAERYAESRTQFVRAGLRKSLREGLRVDLSHAHRLSGPGTSHWTAGFIWEFDR